MILRIHYDHLQILPISEGRGGGTNIGTLAQLSHTKTNFMIGLLNKQENQAALFLT